MKRLFVIVILFSSLAMAAQSVPCSPTATPIASGISAVTFNDATVVLGQTYLYTVAAKDASGNESTCSNVVTAVIPVTGTHSVTLSWTASTTSGVTYSVFRAQAPAPPTGLTVVVN